MSAERHKMTLFEYLQNMNEDIELTVHDMNYDTETYFYNDIRMKDVWNLSMIELSKKLTIVQITDNGVTVNLSDVIERNLKALKAAKLFINCDIDSIMDDIDNILSGNVSDQWIRKFVDTLK
jgi:hypothetical protein